MARSFLWRLYARSFADGSVAVGSGAALAADGPLTDAVDTPEAVRQQLRDYFFNAARFGDNEVLDEFIRAGYDLEQRRRQGLYRPDPGGLQRPWRDRGAPAAAGADACAEDKRGNTAPLGAIFRVSSASPSACWPPSAIPTSATTPGRRRRCTPRCSSARHCSRAARAWCGPECGGPVGQQRGKPGARGDPHPLIPQ